MNELLDAYKKQDRKKFIEEFERRLKKTGEATQQPTDELKELWARENGEMAMETDEAPKSNSIAKNLRRKWQEEDDEAKRRE